MVCVKLCNFLRNRYNMGQSVGLSVILIVFYLEGGVFFHLRAHWELEVMVHEEFWFELE